MTGAILAAVVVATLLVGALIAVRLTKRGNLRRQSRFDDRKPMKLEEIYDTFYADSDLDRTRVIEVWARIGELLQLDPMTLRPSDKFDQELRPDESFPKVDELADLEEFIQDHCAKSGINCPREGKVVSLDDCVRLLAGTREEQGR